MKFVVKSFILLLLSLPVFAKVTLRFKASVYTTAHSLADVIDVTGKMQSCEINKIRLGGKAIPGEVITKDKIIQLFHHQPECKHLDILWLGKSSIPVKSLERSSSAELIKMAKEKLSISLQKKYKRFELKAINTPRPGEHQAMSYQARFIDKPSAIVCVWLESGQEVRQVWFKVKAWCDQWVAKRALTAKSKIKKKDFVLEERECIHIKDGFNRLPKNKQLKQKISEGSILSIKNIEPLALVRRGDIVKIRVKEGAIALDTQGVALSDGTLYQKIKIKNPLSNQTFSGIVTAIRKVEVSE